MYVIDGSDVKKILAGTDRRIEACVGDSGRRAGLQNNRQGDSLLETLSEDSGYGGFVRWQ
jgi:hypothetical protein